MRKVVHLLYVLVGRILFKILIAQRRPRGGEALGKSLPRARVFEQIVVPEIFEVDAEDFGAARYLLDVLYRVADGLASRRGVAEFDADVGLALYRYVRPELREADALGGARAVELLREVVEQVAAAAREALDEQRAYLHRERLELFLVVYPAQRVDDELPSHGRPLGLVEPRQREAARRVALGRARLSEAVGERGGQPRELRR